MRLYNHSNHKHELFTEAFKNAGWNVHESCFDKIGMDDAVIVWNRKEITEGIVSRFERAGARVFVAENGYIGCDDSGKRLISLALNRHLGLGQWYVGEEKRHLNQNIELQDWKNGEDILILGQRGIGQAADRSWADNIFQQLVKKTKRKIRIRHHPGKDKSIPLEDDLNNVFACITHSSGAAIRALCSGVPVFHMLKGWIGQNMSKYGINDIENPFKGERDLQSIGWAQWSQSEMASGLPIKHLMSL